MGVSGEARYAKVSLRLVRSAKGKVLNVRNGGSKCRINRESGVFIARKQRSITRIPSCRLHVPPPAARSRRLSDVHVRVHERVHVHVSAALALHLPGRLPHSVRHVPQPAGQDQEGQGREGEKGEGPEGQGGEGEGGKAEEREGEGEEEVGQQKVILWISKRAAVRKEASAIFSAGTDDTDNAHGPQGRRGNGQVVRFVQASSSCDQGFHQHRSQSFRVFSFDRTDSSRF
jgi:hypothetical protein